LLDVLGDADDGRHRLVRATARELLQRRGVLVVEPLHDLLGQRLRPRTALAAFAAFAVVVAEQKTRCDPGEDREHAEQHDDRAEREADDQARLLLRRLLTGPSRVHAVRLVAALVRVLSTGIRLLTGKSSRLRAVRLRGLPRLARLRWIRHGGPSSRFDRRIVTAGRGRRVVFRWSEPPAQKARCEKARCEKARHAAVTATCRASVNSPGASGSAP